MMPYKIRKNSTAEWLELNVLSAPTPINALDSSKSGRDNNTGKMFRDKVADKVTLSLSISETTNEESAAISAIILSPSFEAKVPNPCTGLVEIKTMYCTSIPWEIKEITSEDTWINKEVQMEWVEI